MIYIVILIDILIYQLFRELTEPECDRDYNNKKLKMLQKMIMTDEDDLENITGEQLQEELDKIIRDYKQKKLETQQTLNNKTLDEKFIISV